MGQIALLSQWADMDERSRFLMQETLTIYYVISPKEEKNK